MSTPLVATYRAEVQYLVSGVLHKLRMYCKYDTTTPVTAPGIIERDGSTTLLFTDAMDALGTALGIVAPEATGLPEAQLQHRVGLVWNPLFSYSIPTGFATTFNPANQTTVVYRDTTFKKIKMVIMEGGPAAPFHKAGPPTGLAALDTLLASIDGSDALPHGIFKWQVGRSDNYILASGSIAGVTADLNDKIRRARGLT